MDYLKQFVNNLDHSMLIYYTTVSFKHQIVYKDIFLQKKKKTKTTPPLKKRPKQKTKTKTRKSPLKYCVCIIIT